MKVTPEQLAVLRERIAPLDTPEVRARYRAGDFPRADRVQDVDKRFRWDLLCAASAGANTGLVAALYDAGCNDSHIDTALRAVVPPLD